jgi:cephalosporin hydroxylase
LNNLYFTTSSSYEAWEGWDRPISVLNIDAAHDYSTTLSDLHRWEPWVVKGGYIFIHDYEYGGAGSYKFEGLRRAVLEYFSEEGYEFIKYLGGTQVIKKL